MATETITGTSIGACACCGSGGGTCDCGCCPAGFWTQYTFTAVGWADLDCVCTPMNGTWTLKKRTGCLWTTDETLALNCHGVISDPAPMWTLSCQFVGDVLTWVLGTPANNGYGASAASVPNFCIDGGVLPSSLTAPCTGSGASVTVSPGGVLVPCP